MEDTAAIPPEDARGARIELALRLPRDRLSVPVIRHMADDVLRELGADPRDVADIELALAEACANVLTHAGPGDVYDVELTIGPHNCVLRIVDVGSGFDASGLPTSMASTDEESGRGMGLMRAVMDQVKLTSKPDGGTVVQLVKSLRFTDDAPARRLMLHKTTRVGVR